MDHGPLPESAFVANARVAYPLPGLPQQWQQAGLEEEG